MYYRIVYHPVLAACVLGTTAVFSAAIYYSIRKWFAFTPALTFTPGGVTAE